MQNPVIDTTVDGHVHTRLCHHARGEMEDYVVSAIDRGLNKIFFLEHLEVDINYFESTWLTDADFDYYHAEGKRLQDKYKDIIAIGLGVEVGYNPRNLKQIRQKLARHAWDRIGISYHFFETNSRHYNMVSRKQVNVDTLDQFGVDKVINTYYQNLLEAVENLPGQVLCHIDAVLRHHPEVSFTTEHYDRIDKLLAAVAKKNMALEVNTSGYKTRDEPYPSLTILKKAVNRKIPLMAGSDAHRPEDVGRFFDRLPELIRLISKI